MKEKRRSRRFDSAFKAICKIGRDIKRACEIKNVSKEGALLILDTPIDRGSKINLSLDIIGDNVPVFVSGTVAWQKESILEPNGKRYWTGIKFAKVDLSRWAKLLERK